MADRYQRVTSSGPGRAIARRLGLPRPAVLPRYRSGDPPVPGPVLVGPDGALATAVRTALDGTGVEIVAGAERPAALVFDAGGITGPAELRALREFFGPRVRSVRSGGRVLVLGRPPDGTSHAGDVARRALSGFVRSLGKEVGRGITVSLVRVATGAEAGIGGTVRFLLSPRSAYVSGQVIDVGPAAVSTSDPAEPLAGRTAVVTGAAQGIGAAIAETLARDGARVVCLDVPAQGEALAAVANRIAGTALHLDITADGAPATLAAYLTERYGGVDILVHNAGVLRDRTLAKMTEAEWDTVLTVNLVAQQAITDGLLADGLLGKGSRVVCLSSLNGIAGAAGQTNYATSKAGVIGLVEAYAPVLASRGGTINAVAPGFIETRMTASMPFAVREIGRRANSLAQGGLPIDVAETVAWLAQPDSAGITGQTVRVCGQNMLGA
ncbi:MAG TPA: 3-oxoacyl-ACP reductase [Actinocatenispora sp.]